MKPLRSTLLCVILLLSVSCGWKQDVTEGPSEVHTIEQEHISNAVTPADDETQEDAASGSDALNLPFSPPISMDPVDGSKVSIRADTPVFEYDGRIYHFGSIENRDLFAEEPEKYLEDSLSRY